MPAKVERIGKNKYKVETPNSVHAKGTSRKKALAQARLLNAIDHGWQPDKKRKKHK